MVFHCPTCQRSFQTTDNGRDAYRRHLDKAHPDCDLVTHNDAMQGRFSDFNRCLKCSRHISVWGAACVIHARRCIQAPNMQDTADLRFRDFFSGAPLAGTALADVYVIERDVAEFQVPGPPVAPAEDLEDIAAVPAPPVEPNAPIVAAIPNEAVAAPVAAHNPHQAAIDAQPRRHGQGPRVPRAQRAGNANGAGQVANVANQAPNVAAAAAPALDVNGFDFRFAVNPSAAQLLELDRLASELSEGCYWMLNVHVKIFRPLVDTVLRIHLDPEGDACLKKLAIYALLILPGLVVRLQRVKTSRLGDVMHEWNRSASPVLAILRRARQTLLLYPRRPSRGTVARINEAKATELVKAQRLGSLMNSLEASENGLQTTTKSAAEMRVLAQECHPVAHPINDVIDDIAAPPDAPVASFDIGELATAITKLPMGSAAGASGWTFHLIRLLYEGEANRIKGNGPSVVTSGVGLLFRFLTTVTDGTMDDLALRKLNTSRLLFVPKGNGNGERPIAIGDSLLRLLLRILNTKYAPVIQRNLEPLQVAVGTRGGCEVMAALAQDSFNHRDYTLALDLHSAFNQVWRRSIATGLVSYAPGLLPIFKRLYGRPSELRSNAKEGRAMLVGESMRGCKQGDPLSMLYFAVAIHAWLLSVKELVLVRHAADAPAITPFTIAYADDIALGGDPAILCSCLPIISQTLRNETGLTVTLGKCKLFGPEPFVLPVDAPVVPLSNQGTILVGVPIGTQAFQQATCATILETASRGAATVCNSRVISAQVMFALLAKCVNARPQYLARNILPARIAPHLFQFDTAIDQSLERILGAQLGPQRAILRSLPLSHSGCGIRRYEGAESINAFNSRVSLVKEFLHTFNQASRAMLRAHAALSALGPVPFPQQFNNHPVASLKEVHLNQFSMVLSDVASESDGQTKAAFLKSGFHLGAADSTYSASGKFLLWSGGPDQRWHMLDNLFISATRRRLCLPESPFELWCPLIHLHDPRGSPVNLATNYAHTLLCRVGTAEQITDRHTYITGALMGLIESCFPVNAPVPVNQLNREVEVGHRPNGSIIQADIVHMENVNLPNQSKVVFDVTIVEPNNRHGIIRPVAGAAVEAAAAAKKADYNPVIAQANTSFVPFALDSNGHIGKDATAYLNHLRRGNPAAGSRIKQFLVDVSHHLAKQTAIAAEKARSRAYQAVWNPHA